MTKEEIFNELLDKKYIIELGENNYVITNLLIRNVPETVEVDLPSPGKLLKQFIKDCKIPFRAKTSMGGFYQLATESEYSRRALYGILSSNKYKYDDLVSATKSYYNNTNMARVTLTNYFKGGVVDQVMEEFKSNSGSLSSSNKTNKVSL